MIELLCFLNSSNHENVDDITTEFRECIHVFAEKVDGLVRHRDELLDKSLKAEAEIEQLKEELDEKTELMNTLYVKHQLEKQVIQCLICEPTFHICFIV